jgi:hypothetical protein
MSCIVDSAASYTVLWWSNLEILFGHLHRRSPFIGELRCQAIHTEHGLNIAERTQKAVCIVRYLCAFRSGLHTTFVSLAAPPILEENI